MINRTILFFCFLAFFSCRNEQQKGSTIVQNEVLESFETFYKRFHQDSAYQMEHVVFPLTGLDNMQGQKGDDRIKVWRAEDWKVHQAIDFNSGEYNREITIVNRGLIEEEISHRTGMFRIFRRFSKSGEDWELIFYSVMNNVGDMQVAQ